MKAKKHAKSLLSLLAACTLLATLSGCGEDGSSSSKADSAGSSSVSDTDSSKADDSAKQDESKAEGASKDTDSSKAEQGKMEESSNGDSSSVTDAAEPIADNVKQSDTGTTSYANSRAKKFADAFNPKCGTTDMTMNMDMMGMEIAYDAYITYDLSAKGQLYMDMDINAAGEAMRITAVAINGMVFTLNHTTKEYTKAAGKGDNLLEDILGMDMNDMFGNADGEEPVFKETGTATVDGTPCIYESFTLAIPTDDTSSEAELLEMFGAKDLVTSYYFSEENGALEKMAVCNSATGKSMYTVNDISDKPNATKFKLPDLTGFTEIKADSTGGLAQ